MNATLKRVLSIVGFEPALSGNREACDQMERGSHRYQAFVNNHGVGVDLFLGRVYIEAVYTRFAESKRFHFDFNLEDREDR